jgi:hypothetical protein
LLRSKAESRQRAGKGTARAEDGRERRIRVRWRAVRGCCEGGVAQRLVFSRALGAAGAGGVVRDFTTARISLIPAMRSLNRS